MTLEFKVRLALEGFPACLACLDHQDRPVRRATEECRETGVCQELEWKDRWVLLDLMDCQVLKVLVSPASKVCEVLPASKVGD